MTNANDRDECPSNQWRRQGRHLAFHGEWDNRCCNRQEDPCLKWPTCGKTTACKTAQLQFYLSGHAKGYALSDRTSEGRWSTFTANAGDATRLANNNSNTSSNRARTNNNRSNTNSDNHNNRNRRNNMFQ